MQDLRLIGVHEDGQHLLLSDADGGRYQLSLDEALRAAARRDRPRLGQLQIEIEGGLRPRDVQSLIRRGLSTEEVADRAGWTVEKVRRFEGPVLAEREHVARIAQQCAVGSRGTGPITLAERVAERLRDRGVDRDDAEWDSARDDEGVWSLTMTFPAGGRQRTATWRYEPLGGSVTASNDEARWLSEEAAAGAIPTPHRAPTSGDLDVYDIDADGGVERAARERTPHEPIDLMAAMREHSARGRRSRRRASPSQTPGEDVPRADALPLEDLALDPADLPPPPASRGRNRVQAHLEEPTTSDEEVGGWPEESAVRVAPEPAADAAPDLDEIPEPGTDDADAAATASGSGTAARGEGTDGSTDDSAGGNNGSPDGDGGRAAASRRPSPARKGRPSVPSWDDIVFGTRGGPSP
ncbi:MAG TPA: septation protein SepH [Ornithinibacter sp.]|nr:septation protein SepH [Ornithinibacter sp.]